MATKTKTTYGNNPETVINMPPEREGDVLYRLNLDKNQFHVDGFVSFDGDKVFHTETLVKIHHAELCKGRNCVVHNPSDHVMREWPLIWNKELLRMSRICPHWHEHPDPDDAYYWREVDTFQNKWDKVKVHNCCKKCFPDKECTE